MKFRDCLQKYAQQAGFVLSEAQVTQLEQYYELLIETNKVMNLTAITEVREVVLKHILDSFYAYEPEIFNIGAKKNKVCVPNDSSSSKSSIFLVLLWQVIA